MVLKIKQNTEPVMDTVMAMATVMAMEIMPTGIMKMTNLKHFYKSFTQKSLKTENKI